ncbi:RNA-directed DNA polymerase, eukaryota, reverse transcriptase zinc-binding domain protein [Tanacetum coccineum]
MDSGHMADSDSCVWNLSTDGSFSVNMARNLIDDHSLPSLAPSTRWYKMIPKKVNIFMWRMFLDRLPNRVNLSSRSLDHDSIACMVCNSSCDDWFTWFDSWHAFKDKKARAYSIFAATCWSLAL